MQQCAGFDLLVTDIVMPGALNGLDLAVKTKALFAHMPIMLMTGYGPNQIVDEGKARALGLLLNKPLDSASLEAAVRHALCKTGPAIVASTD